MQQRAVYRTTVDTGPSDIPTGALRSIYKQAGWDW